MSSPYPSDGSDLSDEDNHPHRRYWWEPQDPEATGRKRRRPTATKAAVAARKARAADKRARRQAKEARKDAWKAIFESAVLVPADSVAGAESVDSGTTKEPADSAAGAKPAARK